LPGAPATGWPIAGIGSDLLIAGAEIKLDEKTNQLKIEHLGTQPMRFTSVKGMKIKKKKE